MRRSFLLPEVQVAGWSSDGLHTRDWKPGDRVMTATNGRSLAIAWFGLHFEVIFAVERELEI